MSGMVSRELHQIDLAPTISDLLDIKAPKHSEGKVMEWVKKIR